MGKKHKLNSDWDSYIDYSYFDDSYSDDSYFDDSHSDDSYMDDSFSTHTAWEDTPPRPDPEETEYSDDEYDEDSFYLARAISMKDIFGDSLDESNDNEYDDDSKSNSYDDEYIDNDDSDLYNDEDFSFQCQCPLSWDDSDPEEENKEELSLMVDLISKVENNLQNPTTQPLEERRVSTPISMVTEQAESVHRPSTTEIKKEAGRRQTLQDMQNAIANAQVKLITHNGGLYYYNGRTYKALGSSYELLELVRSKVSITAFSTTTTKPFFDLLIYLKADNGLAPTNYKSRLKAARHKVVLRNGVLDLNTMELRPHSSTYLTFYELDADYSKKMPRVFLRFLEQVSGGDPEISRRIAEVVGYLLSGLNHRFFFVAGTAQGSGKSTLGLLLQELIGADQVSSISTHQLDRRFALGGTRNKILNIAMDVPKGHLSPVAVSLIKTITGGDPVEIEEKYQPTERLISPIRFLFGTNYPITVSESDSESAFWDRMVILPFTKSVPPHLADLTLLDKLIEEKDEIISYCLRALSCVVDNNMQFSPCAIADQMKNEWSNAPIDSHSWEEFWYSHVAVTGHSEDAVFAMEMYDRYKAYCWDQQYEPVPYMSMRNWIAANVSINDCTPKRIHLTNENPKAGYVGLRFITTSERKDNL